VKPDYWDRAKRVLAKRDPVMAGIMRAHPKVFMMQRGDFGCFEVAGVIERGGSAIKDNFAQ